MFIPSSPKGIDFLIPLYRTVAQISLSEPLQGVFVDKSWRNGMAFSPILLYNIKIQGVKIKRCKNPAEILGYVSKKPKGVKP